MANGTTKTIVFYDGSFPGSAAVSAAELEQLRRIGDVCGAEELAGRLDETDGGVFVSLHAPYFPSAVWESLLAFLKRGGGLISAGGAPFRRPVRQEAGAWVTEPEQTAYHRQLRIHEMLPVQAAPVATLVAMEEIPLFRGREALLAVSDTWNLVPHVTKTSDLPHQMGSAGPMDAHIYPLLKGVSGEGREVAAPVVLWENTKGDFAGGRWLFVNQPLGADFFARGGIDALREWTAFCAAGVKELWLKPSYASYELHERPLLTLQVQKLGRGGARAGSETTRWTFAIEVSLLGEEAAVFAYEHEVEAGAALELIRIPLPFDIRPGYYVVSCTAKSADGETRLLRQGFWGTDAELLRTGGMLSRGRDYFEKDGRPMPVVGMTYMTSDVARKFLFLPNVSVWDRDMAQMRKAGINWIRTGIWTAYRNIMQVDGHASEEVLRSIDAFFMTAKRHGLQVTFTFFSFTPETWEGVNPYLDPRSVEAQKRFIRSIVSRHRETANVDWDLINEPSMFDPPRIFSDGPRSSRDRFEREAYAAWLAERHGSVEQLRERWGMTPGELPDFAAASIPEPEEINFDVQDMHQGKRGTRWLDYALFSMDMHNRWAKELVNAIKEGNPGQLVTVGQDEGLGAQRPSPFFYGEAVDYTTVHSWWLNDHLLWDGIFAKTADKPNVVQETGIMYVETPEGFAKRTEEELRAMLERKYAYSFATGGAGAVQWIWNTNFYMDNANESHIGALRADGTEKPEADVSYRFGSFMEEIRDLFRERELEDVAVVFPYSNDFSNRKLAFDATTRLTRVLGYELKVPFRGVSEYHLESLASAPAKLIIVPSAHNFAEEAFARLLEIVDRTGATLLFTGPLGLDAYWRSADRLADAFGDRKLSNVVREERIAIGERAYPVSYGQRRIAEVFKEAVREGGAVPAATDRVREAAYGQGSLIWCPLPVELNERVEPVAALYAHALEAAGCQADMAWIKGGDLPGIYGRSLRFKDGELFVFVSEYAHDTEIKVRSASTGTAYTFVLERERAVLFAVDREGRVTSVYRPDEVEVAASAAGTSLE
ncbi:glycoside hydrolase [Paenibacillus rhizovicinus]|uniref:Glycoside hydrolase n=1 Tax=Paenibacillus rhizovicinus TaxID=2704463 RepID=A0A6C0P0G1_9BACL|nr:alpha-amylase family protein [Paenibacillus rhizovicinus]QHW31871.1 glycoside hydrolase [Paenibacillus rhizovicinus]